eukprot:3924300-Rhodomonas_salina.3
MKAATAVMDAQLAALSACARLAVSCADMAYGATRRSLTSAARCERGEQGGGAGRHGGEEREAGCRRRKRRRRCWLGRERRKAEEEGGRRQWDKSREGNPGGGEEGGRRGEAERGEGARSEERGRGNREKENVALNRASSPFEPDEEAGGVVRRVTEGSRGHSGG